MGRSTIQRRANCDQSKTGRVSCDLLYPRRTFCRFSETEHIFGGRISESALRVGLKLRIGVVRDLKSG